MFTWVMIFLYFPPAGPGRALGSTQGLLHLSTGWGGREEGGRREEHEKAELSPGVKKIQQFSLIIRWFFNFQ